MKIIYILGDGRSGSTILDSIIGNAQETISVGECCRFWVRFYEKNTLCGCGEKIDECHLWDKVHNSLLSSFETYNPEEFLKKVKYILYFKNFKAIPQIVKDQEWKEFCEMVKHFYLTIKKVTGKETIIDSTKYPNWGYFLFHLDFCELKIIHLERNLQSVANSWKKKIYLPEYIDKKVLMPIKSNYNIIKSWLKIKYLSSKMKIYPNYLFVNYEKFCSHFDLEIDKVATFLKIEIDKNNLSIPYNHSIGGNPVRNVKENKNIKINKVKDKLENLTTLEIFFYKLINNLAKFFLK